MKEKLFIGVDVSKSTLDIYISNNTKKKIRNTNSYISKFIKELDKTKIKLIVVEATGGYEQKFVDLLHKNEIPISVVNPKQTKNFSRSLGKNAKNDLLDAQMLCIFAEKMNPRLTKPLTPAQKKLKSLIIRRNQLVDHSKSEKNRLKSPAITEETKESIQGLISFLKEEIKKIEKQIKKVIKENDDFSNKDKLLSEVSGVGNICSATLIGLVPELGTINRKQIAALVGVAPYDNDSGNFSGKRSIYGGRTQVRNILYMATLSAIRSNPCIKNFYIRLIQKGKNGKVALTACMRKLLTALNAMIRDNKNWCTERYLEQKHI